MDRSMTGLVLTLGIFSGAAGQQDSLDLPAALRIGRAHSPALVAVDAGVRDARGRAAVARSAAYPEMTARAGYVRYQDPPAVDLGALGSFALLDTDTYVAGIQVRQALYTSGRLTGMTDAAESAAEAAEWARYRAEVELTAAIAGAYYDVLLARELERVAIQSAAVLQRALDVARAHYREGTVGRLDVLRAESRASAADVALRSARDALTGAREGLAAILGIPPSEAPPVRGDLGLETPPPAPTWDPERLAAVLRTTRPDLRALGATAEAARARARAARAASRPAIGLFLAGYALNPEPVGAGTGWSWELLGGFAVSWPFFDGGKARGEASAAAAGAERAEAEAARSILTGTAAMRARYREIVRASADIEAGIADVERAERALAIAEDRYANGIGIQLEVLEAEAELTRARSRRARATHAYRTAMVALKRVLGLPADGPISDLEGGST